MHPGGVAPRAGPRRRLAFDRKTIRERDMPDQNLTELEPPPVAWSDRYRRYALGLLMLIYALNMLDRQIITILAEPMKAELNLADWQIGAVSGLAFALFYSAVGLPMARFADRGDRVRLIAISLAVWSAFTAVCGLARTFPQLILARIGVGIGEAGCTPAAHSLITEFTPRAKLASALAFYSLGIPLGSLMGLAIGGLLVDAMGWRAAFIIAGLPGIGVAVIAALTLREPRRQRPKPERASGQTTSLAAALAELKQKPAFWLIALAAALTSFSYYGQSAFFGSVFLRNHGPVLTQLGEDLGLGPAGLAGLALGLAIGVSAGAGTLIGGKLADRAARGGVSGYAKQPMVVLLASTPFLGVTPFAPNLPLALAALAVGVFLHAMAYGPTFASVQVLASPRVRATASAILFFLTSLIGLGLGPLAVGVASDLLRASLGPVQSLNLACAGASITMVASVVCFGFAARRMGGEAPAGSASVSSGA
ncbi:MAG: spinster family MFS transporter [Caulobacter sp.]